MLFPRGLLFPELRALSQGRVVQDDACELIQITAGGQGVQTRDDLIPVAAAFQLANFELSFTAMHAIGADEVDSSRKSPPSGDLNLLPRTPLQPRRSHRSHQRFAHLLGAAAQRGCSAHVRGRLKPSQTAESNRMLTSGWPSFQVVRFRLRCNSPSGRNAQQVLRKVETDKSAQPPVPLLSSVMTFDCPSVPFEQIKG